MGFASYSDYLASDLWKRIRAKVFARKSKICTGRCGRKASQIHHGRYGKDELTGKDITHLYPVCGDCHRNSEYGAGVMKLTPAQATDKLLMRAECERRPHQRKRKVKHNWAGEIVAAEKALRMSGKAIRSGNQYQSQLDDLKRRRAEFRPANSRRK